LTDRKTNDLNPKIPSQTAVESRYLLMPDQANPHGTAFGGTIMGWIDMVASMAAQKHCQKEVVTASIDTLSFKEPINVGDHVILKASVNYVSHSSMEVGVQVTKENPYNGKAIIATTAHLTFVALDENKKPTAAPPITPETDDEKRRFENARLRVKTRKELLRKMK